MAYADAATSTQSDYAGERLDLNLVTAEELATLPGIGIKKAESIIQYREEKGRFLEVEQLTEVKGIGPKLLAKIQNKLQVSQ
ncbi:helix-hairpin-helix domain-containing protein [Salinimonas sp. HHU 13199]|uniref:Helix-hairpin-helix domain-containing protein n=2 Tax=Salinimonas profundi TaxID=2729140 RepID=A0ABR8LKE8_9ALTE|nr:helix-hairpin-helix domain-containing protein [Salinimonas profundi]